MTGLLLRGTDLNGLPVVSIASGDALAEIKDIVYSPDRAQLLGFTLNKRGFFGGPLRELLAYTNVAAVGRDAVMVEQDDVVGADDPELGAIVDEAGGRNVLGDEVLTDDGRRLGLVTDVVLDVASGEVVGYELKGDETLQAHAGRPMLVPIPATLAVSGTALMVPAQVEPFIRDDLTGFGAAVDEFRDDLPKANDAAE
jgi:uncharacterized protein YrrD